MLKTAFKSIKKLLKKLRKNILNIYRRSPRLFTVISILSVCLLLFLAYSVVAKGRPNDDIFFLSSSNNSLLANKNPSFSVNFGKRDEPEEQWVRFEAKATSKNPFENDEGNIFTKIFRALKPKSNYGIEMSLQGAKLSETEELDLDGKEEVVKSVAEIIGTDSVKTSTELVDSGRIIGEYTDSAVSKKTVLNKEVAKGVDIEYQILSGLGLKEEIVIKDMEEYAGDCINDFSKCAVPLNEFVFDLKLDKGLELKKGWFTLKGVSTETYYFVDSDGNYVAHFLPSWAVDGGGNKTYDVSLSVEEREEGNYEAKVIVDASWLFSSDRIYPIRIDPSIIHDSSEDFESGIFDEAESVTGPKIQKVGVTGYNIDANTVGYWKLEETSGSGAYLLDSSTNANHATPTGTTSIPGKIGNGRNFGGNSTSDTVNAGSSSTLKPTSVTVEAWIKPNVTDAAFRGVVTNRANSGSASGYLISYGDAAGKVYFRATNNCSSWAVTLASTTTLQSGQWYYVAATFTNGSSKLYINGVEEASSTPSGSVCYDANSLRIGGESDSGIYKFSGGIDEVRISNIARTPTEIARSYLNSMGKYSGKYISSNLDMGSSVSDATLSWTPSGVATGDGETPYSSTGLVAQWNFNGTSGTSAVSGGSCGTNCNGTLTGMTTSGQDAGIMTGWTANNRRWGTGAIMFDGSDDYVSIPNAIDTPLKTGSFSIEGWFNGSNLSNEMVLIQRGVVSTGGIYYGFGFYASGSGLFLQRDVGTSTTYVTGCSSVFVPGVWYHVVATYDKTTGAVNLYVNGVVKASATFSTSDVSYHASYDQGYTTGALLRNVSNRYSKSTIDSLRIYSRVLSSSEILSNSQSGNIGMQYRTSNDGTTWSDWAWNTRAADGETLYSATNLVAQWNLNDTSGTTATANAGSCGSSCNGSLTNFSDTTGRDILTNSGWTGNNKQWGSGALMFDGSNDYSTTGATSAFSFGTGSFTFELWMKENNNASNVGILGDRYYTAGQNGNWSLRLETSAISFITYDAQSNLEMITVPMNRDLSWHHLVITRSSNTISFYRDGILLGSGTVTKAIGSASSAIKMGWDGNNNYFNGIIDSVRIYSRALPESEIKYNSIGGGTDFDLNTYDYTTAYGISEPGLIGRWSMDEVSGSGAYILDSTANARHGTPSGTTYASGKLGGARTFTNSTDNIQTASASLGLGKTLSVEAWVFPTGTDSAWNWIVSQWDPSAGATGSVFNLSYNTTYQLHFNVQSATGGLCNMTSPTAMTLYTWNHVAATFDGNTGVMSLYLNGVLTTSGTGTAGNLNTISLPITFGKSPFDAVESLKGRLDEVHIYNVVRSASDIYKHWLEGPSNSNTVSVSKDTITKTEGTASERIQIGISPIDVNTMGLWHFDETGGTGAYLKDSTTYGNSGTPTGTTTVDGILGKARNFGGSSSVDVGTGSSLNLTSTLTIEAWVKMNSYNGAWGSIFNKRPAANNAGYTFEFYNNTGGLQVDGLGASCHAQVTSNVVPLGIWTHVAATFSVSGNSVVIYVNGVPQASSTCSSIVGTSATAVIGKNIVSTAVIDGMIDEVRISNALRSIDELTEAYRLGRDHYINANIPVTNFSSNELLSVSIAADRVGNYLSLTPGETPYSNYQPDSYTVGLWHMDETTGSGAYIKDVSGYNNNGTPTGTTVVDGKIGKGRNFDGSNDSINVGSAANLDFGNNGPFTFSGWINPTTLVDYSGFVSKDTAGRTSPYSYMTTVTAAGGLRAYTGSAWIDICSSGLTTSTWYHIAFAYNGTTLYGYINGSLCGSAAFTYTDNAAYDVTIGSWYSPVTTYDFNGKIDEVRIDKIARTANDIRQAYEVGLRTHNVNIQFGANLASSNLISNSGDTSFNIDATAYGLSELGSGAYIGDKIIVKENYNATEYIAQGTVTALNSTTGAVTVSAWDTGSTFPSSGYTANAYVFKWQTEYIPMKNRTLSSHLDGISLVTMRLLDGNEGRNIWIDNMDASTGYLENNAGESLVFVGSPRYFQYKTIFTTTDVNVTPYISAVQLDYTGGSAAPTMDKIMRHGKWFDGGQKKSYWWATSQ